MKILLVHPPARELHHEDVAVPPLGLAYLAAALKQQDHKIKILDAFATGMTWGEFEAVIKKEKADLIGIGGMTPTIDNTLRAIRSCRSHTSFIAVGGPHVSVFRQDFLKECPDIDFGFVGEGEESFPSLVSRLEQGKDPGEIPGLITADQMNPPGKFIADLDRLPFPARRLLPNHCYRYALWPGRKVTTMITSRGCPYQCIFCDKSISGSRWRARSAAHVLMEMEEIVKELGIRSIILYDDLFTLNKERVREICQGILDRGLQMDWKCEGRVDRIDGQTLKWMKKAGCSLIAFGVESGNQASLDYLQKGISLAQIREAFRQTREAGIKPMAYFILGVPVETFAQSLQTIKFAKELRPDYAQFSVLSPYRGTKLYEEARSKGWYREVNANNPFDKDQKRPAILSPYWTEEDLRRILRLAHKSFYFRPGYLLERLRGIRGARQTRSLWKAGCGLLRWYFSRRAYP